MALYQFAPASSADDRLADFDLTVAEIHDYVVRAGLQAAGGVSPLAPPGAQGRHAHDGYVAGLRGLLVPRGWEIEQRDMVARTVHRGRQLAILVARGNEFTAQPGGANYLTTAWPKGNHALASAILPDQDGFESVDDSDFDWRTGTHADPPEWVVWYLLHYRTGVEVRLELSAPTRLDEHNFPRGWFERVILPPYVLGQVHHDGVLDDADEDSGGEPDIPVIPR